MSGSFQSMEHNVCVCALIGFQFTLTDRISVYALTRKSCTEQTLKPLITLRGKSPQPSESEVGQTPDAASCRTASPTYHQLRCSGPQLVQSKMCCAIR